MSKRNPPEPLGPAEWLWQIIKGVIIAAIVVFVLLWLLRTWYIDTHCTMILGTRVCR